MAKSTKARGASFTPDELNDPVPPPVMIRRTMLGGESSLVGMHSSEPLSNESLSNDKETHNLPEHVQTTANLFSQMEEEDSIVDLTDGDGQKETTKPYDEMNLEELRAVCRDYQIPHSGNRNVLLGRIRDHEASLSDDSEQEYDEFE